MLRLRFGIVSTTATYWAHYLAVAEGLYRADGLEVDTVVTGSTRDAVDALLAGEVDLAGCSPDEIVSAIQREGADLVVIGGIVNRPVSQVVAHESIRTVGDLRGRRVGVNQTQGSVSMVLRGALRRAGLPDRTYEQVSIGSTPAMAQALEERRVDAAMLTAPYDWYLTQQGFTSLLNVGEHFREYAFTTINAQRALLGGGTAETVSRFIQATQRATSRVTDPRWREHSLQALATATSLAGPALQQAFSAYAEPGVLAPGAAVGEAALQAVLDLMAEEGLLREAAPPIAAFLEPRWAGGGSVTASQSGAERPSDGP